MSTDDVEPCAAQAAETLRSMLRPVRPTWSVWIYRRFGKRAVDVLVASGALVVLSPLMLAVAAAVRLRLGRPVLFRQQRLGLGARPFAIAKFRTMAPDRRHRHSQVQAERRSALPAGDDPRLTPLGRWLSGRSLDELPQLLHVLRGEMSLVGPRPDYAHRNAEYVGVERARFSVRPGLTGPWQVLVGTSTDLHAYVALDVVYAERYSFANDLRLLAATPRALLRRAGQSGGAAAAAAAGPRREAG